MAREEKISNLLGSAASHTWEAFVKMMKDQTGEVNLGDGDPQPDANDDSGWDVEGNDAAGLDGDPSTPPQEPPKPEDGEPPPAAEPLKTEKGQEPAKVEGEEKLPFHDHPRWKEVMTELKELKESRGSLEADKENLNQQLQFYAEQYNQVAGLKEDGKGPAPTTPIPGVTPQPGQARSPQPQVPSQLPADIIGPATKYDANGDPIGGWADQQQIAQYMDHRANEIARTGMETAYTEKIAPVFDRFNQAITSMQDMLLNLNFPTERDKDGKAVPNSGWDPAYKEALKDVFVMDDAGKVLAVKNQATLNYWQSQPFPKLSAIEHGMRKLTSTKIKEGQSRAIKDTLKGLGTKPKGPTVPVASGGSPKDEVDIGWETPAGSKESEAYLNEKGLI